MVCVVHNLAVCTNAHITQKKLFQKRSKIHPFEVVSVRRLERAYSLFAVRLTGKQSPSTAGNSPLLRGGGDVRVGFLTLQLCMPRNPILRRLIADGQLAPSLSHTLLRRNETVI